MMRRVCQVGVGASPGVGHGGLRTLPASLLGMSALSVGTAGSPRNAGACSNPTRVSGLSTPCGNDPFRSPAGCVRTFMRPSLFLTPINDHHLALASQVGATDIVSPFPGYSLPEVQAACNRVAEYGLKLSVIERYVPHDCIVHNKPGRDKQIEGFKELLRSMGDCGVEVLCYNFMPTDDWTRTSIVCKDRGNALVTEFNERDVRGSDVLLSGQVLSKQVTSSEALWENLEFFLSEVVPVAEASGVKLALHPDDPPMPVLNGKPQILFSVEQLRRAIALVPSDYNGVCFCQGTFASAGEDIPASIHALGDAIHFVHFRDVVGVVPHFRETFQDTGKTDMVAAMKAYKDIGFSGPIRPDHVPTLDGESNENPGYEMLGRLWAMGYIKGLMEAVASTSI